MSRKSGKEATLEHKKRFSVPSALVLLVALVLIAGIASYLVPAGAFERVLEDGRMVVQPGSYHTIKATPVNPFAMFTAIPSGFVQAANIMALCLIIGGAFGIINATGAINAALGTVIKDMKKGQSYIIVLVIMFIASLMGYAYGAAELMLPFIPLAVAACIAMGYDSMTGVGIILLGAGAGFVGTSINPTTCVIAQTIAGLPISSGMWLKNIAYVFFLAAAVVFMFLYMKRLSKNPQGSCMYEVDKTSHYDIHTTNIPEFTGRRKAVISVFGLGIVLLIVCIVKLKFSIDQINAFYLILGVICGIIGKMGPEKMAKEFLAGSKEMLYGALVIGTARAISVVLTDGNILDTITFHAGNMVQTMPASVKAVGMFIVQTCLNVLIPSGSGQAVVTMPIMAPLADLVGMTRQTAVMAYQYGDALTNLVTPTSGYFMAALAMCNIKWEKWIKWFLPLFLVWCFIAAVFLVIATAIHFGPF